MIIELEKRHKIYFPSLNVQNTMHWGKKNKLKKELKLILLVKKLPKLKGKVTLLYERHQVRLLDTDNLNASIKWCADALVQLGIFEDDKPELLTLICKQHKVSSYKDEKITITITEDEKEIKN